MKDKESRVAYRVNDRRAAIRNERPNGDFEGANLEWHRETATWRSVSNERTRDLYRRER